MATIAAAWNVQGDPARATFTDEMRKSFGIALPVAPNTIVKTAAMTALWLGPTSWLLVAGGASALVDFNTRRGALNAAGVALFDVSASRMAWTITGTHAETVLAKGCPLDFHPRAFAAGTCAQSVLGQVNALFVRADEAPAFTVMVARSFARDVWQALCESSAQYGYDVLPQAPYR
jgi:sarcosine oxidase, subunit gamma